jgi:predicted site-specific integrase-resolvase
MQESVSIGRAAIMLGVSISTLRRWHAEGRLIPAFRSLGGHRRYAMDQLLALIKPDLVDTPRITLAYARVSSHDQKADLDRQANRLTRHCAAYQDGPVQVIRDLGSGLNYTKPGFRQLLKLILSRRIRRLVLIQKDRLLRFGAEIIFSLCRHCQVEVVILDQVEAGFEQTLAQDVIELMTVFSARLYGSRSHKNRRALQ